MRSGKYIFDRKDQLLLRDEHMRGDMLPIPQPSREERDWMSHFAFTLGADQEGLTFHQHGPAAFWID